MTFIQRQSVVSILFILGIAMFLESSKAQIIHETRHFGKLGTDQSDDELIYRLELSSKPQRRIDQNDIEQTGNSISRASPETRRLNFAPVIQNTLTKSKLRNSQFQKLKNEVVAGERDEKDEKDEKDENVTEKPELAGDFNTQSDAVEYDLRGVQGKTNKICFILA